MKTPSAASPFELLVVGVKWPPETFIQRKLEGLAARGVRVKLAVVSPHGTIRNYLRGVEVIRISHESDPPLLSGAIFARDLLALRWREPQRWRLLVPPRLAPHRSWRNAFNALSVFVPLARFHPDIAHFEWNAAAMNHLAMFDVWQCPVVISCRGAQINVRAKIYRNESDLHDLRTSFERASAIHCVSEEIRKEGQPHGLDPAKSWIIRPAVDPNFFKPAEFRPQNAGPLRLITTGSLIWRKGVEYALMALRQLVNSGVDAGLDVIGEGGDRERILYTIYDLGLADRVHLLGGKTPEEIVRLLQQSDIFLLASLSEGISNAVLEAMACGLPVVTTECGGMREAVTDGVEGFVVPVRDPAAMAKALMKLCQDAELRGRAGQAARARVLKEFTLDQQIDKWLALYQSVLRSRQASTRN
ncbi:MAG: glycosyltransferase family 4 protein [Verrucomicrobia bacterium]|nr:glycosyltransferase family 4 protein [Verrucomicrobiota bacterium]